MEEKIILIIRGQEDDREDQGRKKRELDILREEGECT
jgi:hypothetical protein